MFRRGLRQTCQKASILSRMPTPGHVVTKERNITSLVRTGQKTPTIVFKKRSMSCSCLQEIVEINYQLWCGYFKFVAYCYIGAGCYGVYFYIKQDLHEKYERDSDNWNNIRMELDGKKSKKGFAIKS